MPKDTPTFYEEYNTIANCVPYDSLRFFKEYPTNV